MVVEILEEEVGWDSKQWGRLVKDSPPENALTSALLKYDWLVLSDEQMSTGWSFSLLNDEQMSNQVRVEHQPDEIFRSFGNF